eukprot:CAMPEP_0204595506 /NCGR_PEP_ID=MMETSP0661-20131031/52713_1 /ASSEMBLY_ACC=CAM_ASM_000606 /TAXON_ID=109239 /ORGANISM="Alexandrium margalefi, Strain AMGDE01CS-322" /LENGTH=102 /DNA_ID=CAMNT_0051606037 /DNA_START=80 /DNA_END=388 /DNA_ORIENTATION=+
MAAARRGVLAVAIVCLLVLWVAAPAFLPSATRAALAPRKSAAPASLQALAAAGAVAPLAAAQPALAVDGDGTISGTEWAGYITIALVLFVFVNAQLAANQGK